MKITPEILIHAQRVWDYHNINDTLKTVDVIFVLGSHDTRVAERGAELFLQNLAPTLLFSGGLGNLTTGVWSEPEAEKFAKIAIAMGVPRDKILIENKSSNTGENILFSYELLKEHGVQHKSMILV